MCVCRSIFLGSTRALYKERNDDDSLRGKCRERNGNEWKGSRSWSEFSPIRTQTAATQTYTASFWDEKSFSLF